MISWVRDGNPENGVGFAGGFDGEALGGDVLAVSRYRMGNLPTIIFQPTRIGVIAAMGQSVLLQQRGARARRMKYNPNEFSADEYETHPHWITRRNNGADLAAGSAGSDVNTFARCSKRWIPDTQGSPARIALKVDRH